MTKIHILSSSLIEKIAAGEVVERPAFAVKELVENAIDSYAHNIVVELESGGIKTIKVKDDGEGMSKDDLILSIQPHSTSKLDKEEDLQKIQTLGFRGEALASIAAISDMSIKSKLKNTPGGNLIELSGSILKNTSAIGMPSGTQVIIENIFQHIPARKKFINSSQSEFRYILDILTKIALSFSSIGFKLIHNKKIIFDLPENQNDFDRISLLLGSSTADYLIPFSFKDSYITISGFMAKPQLQSTNTYKQFIYINKRSVTNKIISSAVKDAYGDLLDASSYPIFLLSIAIPPEVIDVNVHPRKEEIHFIDNIAIYNATYMAIKQALSENNLTFENIAWSSSGKGLTKSFSGKLLKEKLSQETKIILSSDIIQLQKTYIIIETKNGIMLIDQHAASERIYYEKFIQFYNNEKNKKEKYYIKDAELFTLSLVDKDIFLENREVFKEIGF